MYRLISLAAALSLAAIPLDAAEAWFVRFSVQSASCEYIGWADTITLHNASERPATVRLLGVSDGSPPVEPSTLTLAPHQTKLRDGGDDWRPVELPTLWVAHLDLSEGIVVTSHADVNEIRCSVNPSGAHVGRRGAVPLPIVHSLTPANETQVLLRPDIGFVTSQGAFMIIPNRINIGVFNAGIAAASAAIEVRRVCNDSLIERRVVSVASNSIRQFGGFSNPGSAPGICYETYVTVRSDQPGFSYAIALSNDSPPFVPIGAAGGN
jgi:hypothetical protein